MRVLGVISDTHGLLRPSAVEALAGCDRIIHAGDVGDFAVIDGLRRIAPVTAVRGNVDRALVPALPATAKLGVERRRFLVIHDLKDLDVDPREAGFDVVISGHSHRPAIQRRGGLLFVNPGSAGPRRFRLPIAVARIRVSARAIAASIVELPP